MLSEWPVHAARILLVEDSPADARLMKEALREAGYCGELEVMRDGSQAVEWLQTKGVDLATRPDLILLDLNLPKINGHEVLRMIKSDQRLHNIPVIVFSSSQSHRDVQAAYEEGANCYICKPVDLEGTFHVVQAIERFWLRQAQLPWRIAS